MSSSHPILDGYKTSVQPEIGPPDKKNGKCDTHNISNIMMYRQKVDFVDALQSWRYPYVAMSLNITRLFSQLIGCLGASASALVWKWFHFTSINSVQKRRKNLPRRQPIQLTLVLDRL
ncbi:hypothetical protein L1987_68215 [Smallanthus sonchifolius]|uniref:Uncharacterized protein n=1 Tax=Smallanthus sonchifolius TaxID=185202 RepID=A0ACB9B3A0_9ASTR|nr:hypothetical protein L1987_68215 [Smallanthus sonchifolius]